MPTLHASSFFIRSKGALKSVSFDIRTYESYEDLKASRNIHVAIFTSVPFSENVEYLYFVKGGSGILKIC